MDIIQLTYIIITPRLFLFKVSRSHSSLWFHAYLMCMETRNEDQRNGDMDFKNSFNALEAETYSP